MQKVFLILLIIIIKDCQAQREIEDVWNPWQELIVEELKVDRNFESVSTVKTYEYSLTKKGKVKDSTLIESKKYNIEGFLLQKDKYNLKGDKATHYEYSYRNELTSKIKISLPIGKKVTNDYYHIEYNSNSLIESLLLSADSAGNNPLMLIKYAYDERLKLISKTYIYTVTNSLSGQVEKNEHKVIFIRDTLKNLVYRYNEGGEDTLAIEVNEFSQTTHYKIELQRYSVSMSYNQDQLLSTKHISYPDKKGKIVHIKKKYEYDQMNRLITIIEDMDDKPTYVEEYYYLQDGLISKILNSAQQTVIKYYYEYFEN
ncbi:hypothetical protein K6119_00615 [Paracrocinitomix mangrovi]|uniref:hypothetical protein n=1 Tax=Paracrocinitomix mangrovi TaxID=2862509 RepID=UPI001C8E5117|nr:hypothetical protein [Paracrocinitomix mangrovi]UKN02017.1 hypothetical protein K6119_00615 [Paracrocinitomix mangrovi]